MDYDLYIKVAAGLPVGNPAFKANLIDALGAVLLAFLPRRRLGFAVSFFLPACGFWSSSSSALAVCSPFGPVLVPRGLGPRLGFVAFFWALFLGSRSLWSARCLLLACGSALVGRRGLVRCARLVRAVRGWL